MNAQPRAAAAPTLTLTVQASRAAVKLNVGLPASSDTLTVWRVASATLHRADVRGWVDHDVAGLGTALVYDFEAPLGVELVYYAQAVVAGVPSAIGASAPLTLDDERDWLVDLAQPTNTLAINVEALPELAFDGAVGVHRVLDRRDPILTTAPLWTPSGTLAFVTATELERDRARNILGGGVVVLLRTPPERGVGNLYFGVTGLHEQRASRLAVHPDRRFVVDLAQVARPDAALFVPAPPLTYRQRLATWPTYRDVKATGASYQELAYTFTGGAGAEDPASPWLPDDV